MNKKIGIVYDCIVVFLSRRCDNQNTIPKKDIKATLGELFHIPNELREKVIQELINIGSLRLIKDKPYQLSVIYNQ
jgi:hypothetical protein